MLLYIDSTSIYLTLHSSTMALLHSTWLYITLQMIYFVPVDSTVLNYVSTSLYLPVHYSTTAMEELCWLKYSEV